MKYELTEQDYLLLYPLLSPAKICETFKGHTKSPRYIQTLYKRNKLPDSAIAMDNLYKRSFAIADIKIDEHQWSICFMSVISKELCERINTIRIRAEKYKELF